MRVSAHSALLSLALAACQTLSEIPPELIDCSPHTYDSEERAATSECFSRSEAQIYVKNLKRDMYRDWQVDSHVPADASVKMSFTLDAKGRVLAACVLKSSDERLAKSAVRALFAAAPYDAMSERAACIAGHRLIGTFSLPQP